MSDRITELEAKVASLRAARDAAQADADRWRMFLLHQPTARVVHIGQRCTLYEMTLQGTMTIPQWIDSMIARAALPAAEGEG